MKKLDNGTPSPQMQPSELGINHRRVYRNAKALRNRRKLALMQATTVLGNHPLPTLQPRQISGCEVTFKPGLQLFIFTLLSNASQKDLVNLRFPAAPEISIMKLLGLFTLAGLAVAQSSTASPADMSTSAAASTSTSPDYTITALPAVKSAPPCIFNCLIPIGLADPSGCDDVSEDCACLSAPSDVLDFLTGCASTVCPSSSASAYGASATGLYESYCRSVYGNATFAQAFSAEASAAASSSLASVEASSTSPGPSSSSGSSSGASGASGSPSASSTGKSGAATWSPSLLTVTFAAAGGLALLIVL